MEPAKYRVEARCNSGRTEFQINWLEALGGWAKSKSIVVQKIPSSNLDLINEIHLSNYNLFFSNLKDFNVIICLGKRKNYLSLFNYHFLVPMLYTNKWYDINIMSTYLVMTIFNLGGTNKIREMLHYTLLYNSYLTSLTWTLFFSLILFVKQK